MQHFSLWNRVGITKSRARTECACCVLVSGCRLEYEAVMGPSVDGFIAVFLGSGIGTM